MLVNNSDMFISELITNTIDSAPFSIASKAFRFPLLAVVASINCAIFQLL